ncbi:phage holin family protein [Methylomonas sp. EFPC3]|uniref:phage holin family protein n=1 Tax=Methylomonas sp. EFPC3 TaxID=3021710 RepID=UPI002416F31F|nr:phage holin family protein [Methylomonas sp. EFPC3]WFP48516.1 phage holin family protein [Methylomonas sp. EFPC3]
MIDKDPTSYTWVTYAWVMLLSTLGGVVSFNTKLRTGAARPFNIMELLGEILTSAFVGVLTFYLCEAAGVPQLVGAALVGISGHMGSRAIFRFERWAEQRLVGSEGNDRP